jgi:hypothetical protein
MKFVPVAVSAGIKRLETDALLPKCLDVVPLVVTFNIHISPQTGTNTRAPLLQVAGPMRMAMVMETDYEKYRKYTRELLICEWLLKVNIVDIFPN